MAGVEVDFAQYMTPLTATIGSVVLLLIVMGIFSCLEPKGKKVPPPVYEPPPPVPLRDFTKAGTLPCRACPPRLRSQL